MTFLGSRVPTPPPPFDKLKTNGEGSTSTDPLVLSLSKGRFVWLLIL